MNKIKVIIADDHKLIVDGLKSLLENHPEIKIIAEAENGKKLVELVDIVEPHLVITDLDMPIMSGYEAVMQIKTKFPHIKILVLTMHNDMSIFLKMKELGTNGYIHKNVDKEELLYAITQIIDGNEYVSNELQYADKSFKVADSANHVELTKREIEIVVLIAQGLTNIEIGKKLFISDRTVDSHRTNLMRKLNVNNVAGIVRFAFSNHLIS